MFIEQKKLLLQQTIAENKNKRENIRDGYVFRWLRAARAEFVFGKELVNPKVPRKWMNYVSNEPSSFECL